MPSRFLDELPESVQRTGGAALQRERLMTAPSVFTGAFPLVARRPPVTEVWDQPPRPKREAAIPVGSRVFHQKFGYGTVKAAEDDRLDVDFDKAGSKRLLDRFVEMVSA
jgi:DNA helicase-2/ATP-dependent DNA helicase PcrA